MGIIEIIGTAIGGLVGLAVLYGLLRAFVGWTYRIPLQGQALVRTGLGGVKASTQGMIVLPIVHRLEIMDISLKEVVIAREGPTGLICKDNLRADIKVTFYVRVHAGGPVEVDRAY